MKNILNNEIVKSKEVFTTENTLTVDGGDEKWFARVNEKNEYTILHHSSPLGYTDFETESELITHLEGDRKIGKFRPNMGRY